MIIRLLLLLIFTVSQTLMLWAEAKPLARTTLVPDLKVRADDYNVLMAVDAKIHDIPLRLAATDGAAFDSEVHDLELIRPAVRVELHQRALALRADTTWFQQARYGGSTVVLAEGQRLRIMPGPPGDSSKTRGNALLFGFRPGIIREHRGRWDLRRRCGWSWGHNRGPDWGAVHECGLKSAGKAWWNLVLSRG